MFGYELLGLYGLFTEHSITATETNRPGLNITPYFHPLLAPGKSFNDNNLAFGRGVVYVNHSVDPFGGEDI